MYCIALYTVHDMYCTVLYCRVLYCTELYCTVVNCTQLCTVCSVAQSLLVLEYLLANGSERIVQDLIDHTQQLQVRRTHGRWCTTLLQCTVPYCSILYCTA